MKLTKTRRCAVLLTALLFSALLCGPVEAAAVRTEAADAVSCSADAGVVYGFHPSVRWRTWSTAPDTPVTDAPVTDTPVTDAPVTNSQVTNTPVTDAPDSSIAPYEAEVIRLVNEIRVQNGLHALTADPDLCRFARVKSQDMRDNSYFSHNSPVYGTPFQMMKSFGVTYRSAGENIAFGYAAPQAVVDGWMNSEGHRANILNASYTRIGVGYVADGHYWTQWFVG